MPFLPDFPGHYNISLRGTNQGLPWANVFHVGSTAGASDADLSTFASDFADAYDGHMLEHVEDECFVTDVVVTDLGSELAGQGSWNGSKQGDLTGTVLPAQVAAVISWKIDRRYRGGHPRTYLPGVLANRIADNHELLPAKVAEYLSDGEGFLAAVNALDIGGEPVALECISYYSKTETPTPPHLRPTPLALPIVGVKVHAKLGTQRGRLS